MKKIGLLMTPLMAISFLVSCNNGGGDNPPQPDIFSVSCETNGVTISPSKAVKGQDYICEIGINDTMIGEGYTLPESLTKVTSGNKDLKIEEYTYTLKDDNKKADFKIVADLVLGNIDINLTLVSPTPPTPTADDYLCFTCLSDSATLSVVNLGSSEEPTPSVPNLEYRIDQSAWQSVNLSSGPRPLETKLKKDQKIYFRGDNPNGFNSVAADAYIRFCSSFQSGWTHDGDLSVSGNIMSLLYKDDFEGKTTIPEPESQNCGCFAYIFANNLNIVDASNLILPTGLSRECFFHMFNKCEHLVKTPALNAMTLADGCYSYMFNQCRELVEAPYLPANDFASFEKCYEYMFFNCKVLTYVKVGFGNPGSTDWIDDNITNTWLYSNETQPVKGTFEWRGSADGPATRDESTVPENWTIKSY